MSSSPTPFVSIIIVNYNGRHLLHDCLSSLEQIAYPADRYEIIVVDNNSSDDSVSFIRSTFPDVIVRPLTANAGFTGGNAAGLEYAKGDYIVLLNSDVTVDPNWLQAMVTCARDREVGIVNAKLRFAVPFIEMEIESDVIARSEMNDGTDFSPIGVMVENISCKTSQLSDLVWYKSGWYDPKKSDDVVTRWTTGKALVLLPFSPTGTGVDTYRVTVHGYLTDEELQSHLTIKIADEVYVDELIPPNGVRQFTLTVDRSSVASARRWLVQNAGIAILQDGYGKDRGSVVLKHKKEVREFYEEDGELYRHPVELLAACGASCLIKHQVIRDVGFFDPSYYMYYEDQEFGLRAHRYGWKIMYEPTAVAYHKHRATTGKNSSTFFLYHVEKNHLAFLLTHFPKRTALIEFLLLSGRVCLSLLMRVLYSFRDNLPMYETWCVKYDARVQAWSYTIKQLPRLLAKRRAMSARSRYHYRDFVRKLY